MKDAAKWKVGTRFLNNPTGEKIRLHIDDGYLGGGNSIGDIPNIATYSDQYPDITDIKPNHFDQGRESLFYYCIFGHKTYTSDNELHLGVRPVGEPNFLISDEYMDTLYTGSRILGLVFGLRGALISSVITNFYVSNSKSTRQAGVFMHELGHALNLSHPEPPFKETHSWIPGISKLPTGFGPLDEKTCMNY